MYVKSIKDRISNYPELEADILDVMPYAIDFDSIEDFVPKQEWFLEYNIWHGIAHETRVLLFAELINNLQGGSADIDSLRWAAITHDTQRSRDRPEEYHGAHAAGWIRGMDFPCADIDTVADLNEWHVPDDPTYISSELTILKDADSLDRYRLRQGLDEKYLRTAAAKKLSRISRELFLASHALHFFGFAEYKSVIEAARAMKLIKD